MVSQIQLCQTLRWQHQRTYRGARARTRNRTKVRLWWRCTPRPWWIPSGLCDALYVNFRKESWDFHRLTHYSCPFQFCTAVGTCAWLQKMLSQGFFLTQYSWAHWNEWKTYQISCLGFSFWATYLCPDTDIRRLLQLVLSNFFCQCWPKDHLGEVLLQRTYTLKASEGSHFSLYKTRWILCFDWQALGTDAVAGPPLSLCHVALPSLHFRSTNLPCMLEFRALQHPVQKKPTTNYQKWNVLVKFTEWWNHTIWQLHRQIHQLTLGFYKATRQSLFCSEM